MKEKTRNVVQQLIYDARYLKPVAYKHIAKEINVSMQTMTKAVKGETVSELTELRLKHYLRKIKKELGLE